MCERSYRDYQEGYASFFILDHILSILRVTQILYLQKGVATVGLLITTEDIDLHVAMSHIQLLRDALIDRFTAAGIPGASINAARCSSDPQFGVLRRNLNAYEVFAQLEVEACSVERPRLQAAAADGRKKRAMKSVSALNCAP